MAKLKSNNAWQFADASLWQGRLEKTPKQRVYEFISCLDRQNLLSTAFEQQPVLLGFCCDLGVLRNQGRIGAAKGPDGIRQSLAKLAINSAEKCPSTIFDAGNVLTTGDDLETSQESLASAVANILENDGHPIILGGGHETAWGHYLGLSRYHQQKDFAILNFDAHFDLRPLLENDLGSSGTPFLQISQHRESLGQPFHYYCMGIKQQSNTQELFETAKEKGVCYLTCDEIYQSPEMVMPWIDNIIQQHRHIYVSICMDVFSQSVAPGVSASHPYGLMPWHVIPVLKKLVASKHVIAKDIVEYAPNYDIDYATAKLAATLALEMFYS